jgi:hypothetical protein
MDTFQSVSRWSKVWILATITSLTLYGAYWVQSTYNWLYVRLQQNVPNLLAAYPNFYIDHVASAIGDTFRLVGVIVLFIAAYLGWGPRKQSFFALKKYIAIAISFEAIYWFAILPYNIQSVARTNVQLLSLGFFFQILAAAPLLLTLAVIVWKYKVGARTKLVKWGCIAGIGYIFGMWINYLLRWLGQSGSTDPRLTGGLFSGFTAVGFFNTVLTLTLSLVFAVAGSYMLIKQNNKKRSTQLLGVAILLFGLYFAIYILYCWFAPNAWRFVLLTDIWPAPLIGLGIGLLRGKI